jgi:hypothetical protein
MKYLGLMHYFLGLEVWQSPERIFLNQGKYMVEILKIFNMLECKPMNTPLEAKLKMLVDTSSELIDTTVQIDYWIVDVPDEHQTRHLFFHEHLESVSSRTQMCSPSGCKTCDDLP